MSKQEPNVPTPDLREAVTAAKLFIEDDLLTRETSDREVILKFLNDALASPGTSTAAPAPTPAAAYETCAQIADRAALRCVREQVAGDATAKFIAAAIRAMIPLSHSSTLRCPPMPELKYVREPCHMCGAVTEGEAEMKCRPSTDQTGERYCGCDTFDADGYALGPTLESMAAQESWYKSHHSCSETCSVSSIVRGDK